MSSPKFSARLTRIVNLTVEEVVADYVALAEIVTVQTIDSIVPNNQDDDEVIVCAVVAEASYIISGAQDLLNLVS